jgi:succinate dehydrogenase / fumarate reductase cytochrome b subunit
MASATLPKEFIWRRLHSLMGLWLVLFLIEHLFVNSQAALLLGDNAQGFVRMVNSIHNLPYLPLIELFLLGVPILIHLIWGVRYLFTSEPNSWKRKEKPSLPEYGRNRAYTWQRITSWILLIGIIGHVVKFRFLDYPLSLEQGIHTTYFVRLTVDKGLYTVADRLGASIYSGQTILEKKADWAEILQKKPLHGNEVIGVTDNFATASLLTVRDTFKHPLYVGLYTVFVLAACFHAFNGFWTFLISWGVVLNMASQQRALKLAMLLMAAVTFLGLAAVWGTYWINLKS